MNKYKQPIYSFIQKIGFERLAHALVLLFIFLLFYPPFHRGFILFGDLATTFPVNHNLYLKNFSSAWSDNAFLGYNSLLYAIIRKPFYLLTDSINLFLGPHNWWVFLIIMYWLRYYLFFAFLRFLGVRSPISTLAAAAYSFNFFFVDRLGHTLISFASIAIPGLIVGYLSSLEKIKISSAALFIGSFWVVLSSMHVTLMTAYFFALFVFWQALLAYRQGTLKQFIRNTLVLGLLTFSFLLFIFVPILYQFFFTGSNNLISQVARQASEAIYSYSKTTLMPYTLVGLGFYGSGFWQLPLVTFVALLFLVGGLFWILYYPDARKGGVFYLALIIFGGLASISIIEPFIKLLKQLLPGFNSIKDSSYFILFAVFALFTLLALSIEKSKKVGWGYLYLSAFVVFMISTNIFAFNRFKDFKTAKIPAEFNQLPDHLDKNKRTLVLPIGWVSRFPWSNDQIMSGFFTLLMSDYQIVGQNIIEGPSLTTQLKLSKFYYCFESNCPAIRNFFSELDIDQIVLFKGGKYEFQDIVYDYSEQIRGLVSSGLLEQTSDNQYYSTYQWKGVDEGRVRGAIKYRRLSPAKYEVLLKASDADKLTLLTSFDRSWKIFPSSFWFTSDCQNTDGKSCRGAFNSWIEDLSKLFQRDYFSSSHALAFNYANSWEINSSSVLNEFPQNAFYKTEDGEIVAGVTIYYLPQAAILLGLAGSVLFASAGVAIIIFRHRRKAKWG